MLILAVLLALALLVRLNLQLSKQRTDLMALGAEVIAFIERLGPQIDAAVADIQKLHDILEGSGDPDIEAARAALAAVEAKLAALSEAVAIPEPGDETPPPPSE